MILPITAYGHPILKVEGSEIDPQAESTHTLISNMYETMDHCNGVGLAAPQVNVSVKVFVIDSTKINKDEDERMDKHEVGKRMAFINPKMIREFGNTKSMEEGCLSIPGIYASVTRHENIEIEYTNEHGERLTEVFSGFTARVIQHEYDHIMGKLFLDHIKPLKKQLLKKKLEALKKGITNARYKMVFG